MTVFDQLLTADDFTQDPYPAYRALTLDAPVYWCEPWNAWLVSSMEAVTASLRDHASFSSEQRLIELIDDLPPEHAEAAVPLREHFGTTGLVHSDPPDHRRLRSIVSRAFTSRVVDRLRPRIQALVDELLDAVTGGRSFDIVGDLAHPLPAIVIGELFGARRSDRELFQRWSDDIVAFQGMGRAVPGAVARSARGLTEMRSYLAERFEEGRLAHSDDVLGILLEAEHEGDRLTVDELYSTCVTFLIGGHETTTSLIANGMYTLLSNGDQMERLREDRSLLGGAIEECLRFESPIQRTFRRVTQDMEWEGQTLGEGDIVIQLLGAANRDPRQFHEPERFDILRDPNRHVAFGSGIHYCVGAPLARLEAEIAFTSLLDRFESIELEEAAVEWQEEKALFRCVERLRVAVRAV